MCFVICFAFRTHDQELHNVLEMDSDLRSAAARTFCKDADDCGFGVLGGNCCTSHDVSHFPRYAQALSFFFFHKRSF